MTIALLLFSAALSAEPPVQPADASPAPNVQATAPATSPPVPRKKSAKAADPDRVCKLEPLLGSRLKSVVCYNRAQMEERTFYDKANLDKIQAATPGPN
jgi:hypothetical protein